MNDQKNNRNAQGPDTRDSEKELGVLTRRNLLVGGASASVIAASSMIGASAEPHEQKPHDQNQGHVIVVGGGFCGVTAARELTAYGYNVTLLEARNRLGGRTFTAPFADEMVDMGGTWVHWLQPHVWAEISRYGMELEETLGAVADDIIYLDYEGKRHTAKSSSFWNSREAFDQVFDKFFANAYWIMPRPADPFADDQWVKEDRYSIQDKLDSTDLSEIERIMCDMFLTTCGSAPPEEISWVDMMRMYALSGYSGVVFNDVASRFKIKGGTKTLLDRIAADSRAQIRLATPVYSVTQTADGVEVVTDADEVIKADALISTVPLNVLKDVKFTPALSAGKLAVSRQTHAGQGTKIHIQLDKEYPIFSGWAPGGNTPLNYILWDGVKNGHTHLIAFGPSTETLDMNDGDAVQAAIRQFLPDANVINAFGYGWNVDPYSQGVWAISRPGQMSKYIKDLQAAEGRIHFASADWASGWRGTIDGAIEQGLVTARNVRKQLSEQA